jgi:hypothetical protein
MKNVNQIFDNLRKAVNSSKPNVRYKQIMAYIDTLEEAINAESSQEEIIEVETPSTEEPQVTTETLTQDSTPTSNEDIAKIVEEVLENYEVFDVYTDSEEVNLENLSLAELRGLYPNIKSTSKNDFLEQLKNL